MSQHLKHPASVEPPYRAKRVNTTSTGPGHSSRSRVTTYKLKKSSYTVTKRVLKKPSGSPSSDSLQAGSGSGTTADHSVDIGAAEFTEAGYDSLVPLSPTVATMVGYQLVLGSWHANIRLSFSRWLTTTTEFTSHPQRLLRR